MTSSQILQWIQHPELLNRETLYELRTLIARYPYFQSLRLLYLKNLYLLHDVDFASELRKSVLYVADRRVLFYLIEGEHTILKTRPVVPLQQTDGEEPSIDRTLSLIDAFLSTLPEEQSQQPTELDYSMDYTSLLLQQTDDERVDEAEEPEKEAEPSMRGQSLIDSFIKQSEQQEENLLTSPSAECKDYFTGENDASSVSEPVADVDEEEDGGLDFAADDDYFTETLAKIYVKQHRYDKALEIIKKLSLNYPKKNAYFADQIRFLEKLIINAKSK